MSSLAPTTVRLAVILLALAGIAGQLAYLDALWWHTLGLTSMLARNVSPATIMLLTAHAIVGGICAVLSIALVLHEGVRAQAARALGTAFGSWSYLMAYSGVTMLFRPDPGITREFFEAHFLLIEAMGLIGLLSFTGLFPRPLGREELRSSETLPRFLLPLHRMTVFMRSPRAATIVGIAVLITLWGVTLVSGGELSDAGLSPATDVIRFCTVGIVVINVRRGWDAATEGDRDGLTWLLVSLLILLAALSVLMGGNVFVAVTGFPEPNVAWRAVLLDLGVIGFLCGLAMSVLQRGTIDPLKLTRRIASATVILTAGLFLAAGLEGFLAGGILATYSVRAGVGTAISFAIILATRRGLIRLIDRALPSS